MSSVNIPASDNNVKVSVIDTGSRINVPMSVFMDPALLEHKSDLAVPAYSFLIEQEKLGRKLVYDLGIRKDVSGYAPVVLDRLKSFKFYPAKDVHQYLKDGGVDLKTIEAVIWSHHHVDHVGDPSGFPSSTDLIVGPGFKETQIPGYPENTEAEILVSDYEGRNLRQIDFETESNGLMIGGFRAVDYFDDGSFYLLETPGHTIDHIAGLARTGSNPPRFILMGGDLGHHASQWRPNSLTPLPKELTPSPFGPDSTLNIRRNVCPCTHFMEYMGQDVKAESEPLCSIRSGLPYDVDMARKALKSVEKFDADENIMLIMAHDWTLLDVMQFWPEAANQWQESHWKERGRWEFLKDLVKD